jgi:beta-fructofuranosidase
MPKGDEIHVYHLQRRRPEAQIESGLADKLGHAVTRDLVHWQERPPAFGPDPVDVTDDLQPWTGCCLWREGVGYLFYTMRGSSTNAKVQRIGLATTSDADAWTRYPGNPVIIPDERWYATEQAPVPGTVDCRDLLVVSDPSGGWFGYYATRQPGTELPETSVIACVHSDDLIHWEHRPPAFAPQKYACIEVPDVFEMNGLWYMTILTGNWYGNRGFWSDPNLVCGTLYAVAERPEGPFTELADSALLAGRTTAPLSCRSLVLDGERYLLYTDRERSDHTDCGAMTWGSLSTPKALRTTGDRLYAAYCSRIESEVARELIGAGNPPVEHHGRIWGQVWQKPTARWRRDEVITGDARTGWGVMRFDSRAAAFIYEATVTIGTATAAGLALRLAGEMEGAIVVMEPDDQVVAFYSAPAFDFSEKRLTVIQRDTPIHLRIVNRLEHMEIYVDDALRLAFSWYAGIGGDVGLFVDRGRASFENIRFRELNVTRPT